MNDNQHDALREYTSAVSQVRLKKHELRAARLRAAGTLRKLRAAILRDPESWAATEGSNKPYDVEGEVVHESPAKGQEQEAITRVAPHA